MKRHSKVPFLLAFVLLLAGCSDAPKPVAQKAKDPEKPPEPATGQKAFYQMYGMARQWAPDVQVLRVRSVAISEVKSEAGKSGAWEATFVSQSRKSARSYTYSVVESSGNLHKGVFAGLEEGWSGPRGQAKPFLVAAVKTDTDKAYEVALKKGADYAKKNPDMPISFVLESTPLFPDPAWRVIWGESVTSSNFSIFVDAVTGEYLQTMR